jgi:predicted nucleic acid-binding protein
VKVLLDTNVVLDVLMNRTPHADAAAQLFVFAEQKKLNVSLGATTVTTIHYLMQKSLGARAARRHISSLLSLFEVAPVNWDVLSDALSLSFPDFEDAVLHEAARHTGAHGIVTRDPKGFSKARLPVYSPLELLKALAPPRAEA